MKTINVSIIAFDDFTDVDVFLLWDLLKRIKDPMWNVQILGEKSQQRSSNGLLIPTHAHISFAKESDAVLFGSGPGMDVAFRMVSCLLPDRQPELESIDLDSLHYSCIERVS